MRALRPVAITPGDAAGIGPEIVVRAFLEAPDVLRGCFVAGGVATMRRAAAIIAGTGPIQPPVAVLGTSADALDGPPGCVPVLPLSDPGSVVHGKVSGISGNAAAQWVAWAAQAALRGEIAAMVTAPLNKEALAAAGAPYGAFPGHTELLQAEAARHLGKPIGELPVRMMLANDELRIVLVSIHMALREAIDALSIERVLTTLRIAHRSLRPMLGRDARIAVSGLNPHAGEGGLFGREEIEVIAPAIEAARMEGIDAHGPYAPDTVFMRARAASGKAPEFDTVVAMYHDQGLIPVKYLGMDKGVNVTLGLPLVRTSPDHGTAFDIAGTGKADPGALIEAVRMARHLSAPR